MVRDTAPHRFSETARDFDVFILTRCRQAKGVHAVRKRVAKSDGYFAPFGTVKQYIRSSFDFTQAGVV